MVAVTWAGLSVAAVGLILAALGAARVISGWWVPIGALMIVVGLAFSAWAIYRRIVAGLSWWHW